MSTPAVHSRPTAAADASAIAFVIAEVVAGLLAHARDGGFKRVVGRLPDNNEAALSFLSSIGGLAPISGFHGPPGADGPEWRSEFPL